MSKEILQITISSRKASKYKLIRWFQNQWFVVWNIWRPKMLSKFYWFMSEAMLRMLPKEKRDELLKEFDEIEVHIVDNTKQ